VHPSGQDSADATSSPRQVPDFAESLPNVSSLSSRPLTGKRVGIIRENTGAGVSAGVSAAFQRAAQHVECLGATVEEVQTNMSLHLFKNPSSNVSNRRVSSPP
jgi:aspartyl-tRNA(Asn)/glutamyl-tRNA(Gln) amidotransferase subunit A